jgi:hypothetical protein
MPISAATASRVLSEAGGGKPSTTSPAFGLPFSILPFAIPAKISLFRSSSGGLGCGCLHDLQPDLDPVQVIAGPGGRLL